jgi:hypothetical protein
MCAGRQAAATPNTASPTRTHALPVPPSTDDDRSRRGRRRHADHRLAASDDARAGGLKRPLRHCWCTAAHPASAPPPFMLAKAHSAPRSSPPLGSDRTKVHAGEKARRRRRRSTTRPRTSSTRPRNPDRRRRAPTSSSTSSAATTSIATTRPPPTAAASSQVVVRSASPKATPNFAKPDDAKRLHHTGSTLRPRTVADKAAIVKAQSRPRPWPLVRRRPARSSP